ncbi:hypothetical protein EDC30_105172 [Paucimonas lemoignei]|uniref:HD/PDEase domain-containing protein n=1 Tax=Paucimonas lemoignei TaxID=29443 RepID=A0A4V2UIP3_PAULE|nr:hypothetical protein [Paucimonas lemoignei]TCS36950.1 hypothetical protein EDC30_105172 [Paucimonas lemoignei]
MQVLDHLDVTHSVDLTDPLAVCTAVCAVLEDAGCTVERGLIERGFDFFSRLYAGELPEYHGCETFYHDMQHALDVTLACARLLAGHEHMQSPALRLGAARVTLGVIVALLHDAGYLRRREDRACWHGAQYTLLHVGRGSGMLSDFLRREGRTDWAERASKLIHFTGYEIPLDQIELNDPLDRRLGHLIGTADLIAQMADRMYLEKCRDYLFEEFELGGLTTRRHADGSVEVIYGSRQELLSKTPAFYQAMVRKRLDKDFQEGYRYLETLFDGRNPYLEAIERNIAYLQQVLDDGHSEKRLRRRPEPVLAPRESAADILQA